MNFAEMMNRAMKEQRVTAFMLAKRVGVTPEAIQSISRGDSAGSALNRYKIAKALGLDITEVFPEEKNMTIGRWARLNRLRLGVMRKELSERSGVSEPTITKFESDGGAINMYSLIELANALNIGIDEYIGRRVKA